MSNSHELPERVRQALESLCRSRRVQRLELFGSASRDGVTGPVGDIDLLVEFLPMTPEEHADAYFGLLEELQELFGRPVDLVMTRAVRNRFFLEHIASSRKLLYAA